jgi:beta-glucosidase
MQLRGFKKIKVAPGSTQAVQLTLTQRDLSVWSLAKNDWVEINGAFKVAVGSSSADAQTSASFTN